ncbi:TraE/TraK family type IV conjugative transfer system protein [Vibrio sp. 10N.222.54.A1]|uniref:TraE/TraK family type IV conjugative transfer system protein n=1 Tax=unclassified Vibrio TaxID=2614977 RepID=UPI0035537AE9
MNFNTLKSQFGLNATKNSSMFISNSVLSVMLLVSVYYNFQKDTIVINNLNEHCLASQITYSTMNEDNHKRLGSFLSGVLGNITPSSSKYVVNTVLPYVSPELYHDVKEVMALQVASLQEDEIVMTFSAERAQFEDGITYITGKGSMTGPTGISNNYVRTYEFRFEVENYTPTFTYMDVYEDVAHNNAWKEKNQANKGAK